MRLNDRLDHEAKDLWGQRPATRDKLIEHYLIFAEKLASSGYRKNERVSYEECLSAAHMALIESVDKFREGAGAAFTTFATWRIRGAIIDAARDNDWVPHSARSKDKSREDSRLPVMMSLDETYDSPTADRERWEADIESIAKAVEFAGHRRMVEDMLNLGMSDAIKHAGCSTQQFKAVIQWAMKRAAERN